MDILKSKTVTGSEGFSAVSSGGLGLDEIISVQRQGLQQDYVAPLSINSEGRAWTMFGHVKRIIFNSTLPFGTGGETIFIIYKVTT